MPLPFTPSSLRDFRSSASLTEALSELINDPTFRRLMSALREVPLPRSLPKQVPGVHHDTTIAHQYHWNMGFSECLDQIIRAALPPGNVHPDDMTPPEDEEFASSLPANLQMANRPQ